MAGDKKMIEMPNLRQLVGFCVFMQNNEGILGKAPSYLLEKFEACRRTGVPEGKLDDPNQFIMAEYGRKFGLIWDPAWDYWEVPVGKFNMEGEADPEFRRIPKQEKGDG